MVGPQVKFWSTCPAAEERAGPRPSGPARRRRGGAASSHTRRTAWGFLAPFGLLFTLFYLVPIAYAVWKSFYKVERASVFARPVEVFAGLDNYALVFSNADFRDSVVRILVLGLVQVPVMLLLALAFALLLDSAVVRGKRFFRLAYFLPYGVPGVIAAIMWGYLYTPNLSPINDVVDVDLLSGGLVLWSIANIVTWTYTGYNMLIIYSALQAIPPDIYEAARIDGASGLAIAWRIKVPIVRPALVLTAVFSIIGTLQLFTEPAVMRQISTVITSTYTPTLAAYSQVSAQNYGLGAAMSVVLALATFVLSFAFLKLTQRRVDS
jgi:multiple sugar transport system permease protein